MQSKLNSTNHKWLSNFCMAYKYRDVYATDIEISRYAEREHQYCGTVL